MGGGSSSAIAAFSVNGPSGASITAVTDPVHNGVNIFHGSVGESGWVTQLGRPLQESPGITFTASAALPSGNQGQYAWLQLLNTFNVHYRDATGRWACGLDQSPELDGLFTLNLGASNEDSPPSPLNPGEGEHEAWFQATQYLMWQPNPDSRLFRRRLHHFGAPSYRQTGNGRVMQSTLFGPRTERWHLDVNRLRNVFE